MKPRPPKTPTKPSAAASDIYKKHCAFKSSLQRRAPTLMLANPTPRQRVDRSSPLYKDAHQPSCPRIPLRGSVWIVQVLSTKTRTNPHARESHRGSVWILQVLS